jgi:hypothetical protein
VNFNLPWTVCLALPAFVKELNTRINSRRLLHIQNKTISHNHLIGTPQPPPRLPFPSKLSTFTTTGPPKKKEIPGILIHSLSQQQEQNKRIKMATTFKQVDLFGGAITADFPAAFGDVR